MPPTDVTLFSARWLPFDPGRKAADGYLDDIDAGTFQQTPLLALDDLVEVPCLVLLGQAGMGKTSAAYMAVQALLAQGEHADLLSIGSEPDPDAALSQLLRSKHHEEYKNGNVWHIFLDGLDEAAGPPTRMLDAIERFVTKLLELGDRTQLRLRFLCRTAAWSAAHDRMVESQWADNEVRKLELGPLRRADVAAVAASGLPDAHGFIEAIDTYDAQALAARPVLLQLLLEQFHTRGSLPQNRSSLYRLGLEELVKWSATAGSLGIREGHDRRLVVAGRIAAAMIFSGLNRITADPGISPTDAVRLADLAGSLEPAADEALAVTNAELRAALGTKLFERIAPDTFEWAHRSFMEYLAADYLFVRQVPAPELWNLLGVEEPDGGQKIAPQLREIAAWLASRMPDFFRLLIERDPEVLLRSDLAAAAPQDRALLVDALLDRIAAGELLDHYKVLHPFVGKLAHADLSTQLASRLADRKQSDRLRRIAIDIAAGASVRTLVPTLLALAKDAGDAVEVRKAAVDAVAELGTPENKASLAEILVTDLSSDVDDELLGSVLRTLWPDQLSVPDLLAALSPNKNEHLIGAYAMFLYQLDLKLSSPAEAAHATTWLARALRSGQAEEWASGADRLFPRLFWEIAQHIDDGAVQEALADLLAQQLNEVTRYIFHGEKPVGGGWPEQTGSRVALVLEALRRCEDPARLARGLLFQTEGLVRPEDLSAYLDAISISDGATRKSAVTIIIIHLARQLPLDSLSPIWLTAENEPVLRSALQGAYSVKLASPEAEWMRTDWERKHKTGEREAPTAGEEATAPLTVLRTEIATLLSRIDGGEVALWWQLNLQLFISASGRYHSEFEFRGDLRATPGWELLPSEDQTRVIRGAAAYLQGAPLTNLKWLGTNTSLRPATAGFRAMRLLLAESPDELERLDDATWRKWAPVTLGFIENDVHADGWAQQHLLAIAYSKAPEAVLRAVTRIALGPKSRGLRSRELDLLASIADENLHALVRRLANHPRLRGEDARSSLYGLLARTGDTNVIERVRAGLEVAVNSSGDESRSDWLVEAAAQLLSTVPTEIWFELLELGERSSGLARAIWERFAQASAFGDLSFLEAISDAGLARAFVGLARLFPEPIDESGRVRSLGTADYVERIKSFFLSRLINAGTREAVGELREIARALPQADLSWPIEQALAAYRTSQRSLRAPGEALAEIAALGARLSDVEPEPSPDHPTGRKVPDRAPSSESLSLPDALPSGPLAAARRQNLLAFATEWNSGHGGISTLNRELCIALASLGHSVWCAVTEASASDIEQARSVGVRLIQCPHPPGIDGANRLLLLQTEDFDSTDFHAVLGHDHITGPYAAAKAKQFGSKYVHFLHTVPDETESLKTRGDHTGRLLRGDDKRRNQIALGQTADLIVAIGPKIYGYAQMGFDANTPLLKMMPGLNSDLLEQTPKVAAKTLCLLTARMEDASGKGLFLGCEAVRCAGNNSSWPPGTRPRLVARGFDKHNADAEYQAVIKTDAFKDVVIARPYSADGDEIRKELLQASLVLMPSHSEAFGLTGYEAIAAGIPALISDESGLAEYLAQAVQDGVIEATVARGMLLPGRDETAESHWAPRIIALLSDREAAFRQAAELRAALRPILSWNKAARQLSDEIAGTHGR